MARNIVPNINRLADGLRRAGGTIVWIISTTVPAPSAIGRPSSITSSPARPPISSAWRSPRDGLNMRCGTNSTACRPIP